MQNFPILIITTFLIVFSWFCLSFSRKQIILKSIFIALVAGLGQIITTELFLGLFGNLYILEIVSLNILASVILLYISFRIKPTIFKDLKDAIRLFLSNLKISLKSPYVIFSLIVFCALIVRTISWGLLLHPYDWDGIEYHLPVIVEFMKNGRITEMPSNLFTRSFYPYTIELAYLWNLLILKNDVLVNLSQFFFSIIGATAIFGIAREIGIKNRGALLASMLWFFAPISIMQSTTLYIDLAASSIMLAFVYSSISYFKKGGMFWLFASGVTAGIYMGSKFSAVVIILGIAFVSIIYALFSKIKLKNIFAYILSIIFFSIIISGFWFISNYVKHGNPLYPHKIEIGSKIIFDGPVPIDSIMDSNVPPEISGKGKLGQVFYSWVKTPENYIFDTRIGGLGPLWVILFLPAIIIALVYSIITKNYTYLLFFAIILISFAIHPANWWGRYTIFIFGLGAISYALLFGLITGPSKIIVKLIEIAILLFVILTTMTDAYGATSIPTIKKLIRGDIYLPGVIHDSMATEVHKLKGKNIAYGPGRFMYSAYGTDFSNNLIYIPTLSCEQYNADILKNNIDLVMVLNIDDRAATGIFYKEVKELILQNKCVKSSPIYQLHYKSRNNSEYELWETKKSKSDF